MSEIEYDNYFWQNKLVRLRAWSESNWEWDYRGKGYGTAEMKIRKVIRGVWKTYNLQ